MDGVLPSSSQDGVNRIPSSSAFNTTSNGYISVILSLMPPLWAMVFGLFLLLNLKNFPLMWHVSEEHVHRDQANTTKKPQLRIVNALSYVLKSQRITKRKGTLGIFDPIITESYSSLGELDFNLHSKSSYPIGQPSTRPETYAPESNSTYFSDLDISRAHLICTLFNPGIEAARFAESNEIIGGGDTQLVASLGGVTCDFKREIKPYRRYEMWSRILCWDSKWFWVVTHFVDKEGQSEGAERTVFASATSKCVFKKGRLTVRPAVMLRLSGLLPDGDSRETHNAISARSPAGKAATSARWVLQQIEDEREHGLRMLRSTGLDALSENFKSDRPLLVQRQGLDSSLLLIPRIGYLFCEWTLGRAAKLLQWREDRHGRNN